MAKQSINPEGAPAPVGPYVHVTVAPPGGRIVHCAGAVALDANGEVVGKGDIAAQTRQTLENLKLALEAAGATFDDVVKINSYVTDFSLFPQIAPIRAEYLKEPFPASTTVQVSALIFPELMIEIEAIAIVHDGD
ncbi:MAG TPA: RidA family protein [Thermoleophilaceae bacterium]|nr:RidA family protein [Thermoleophilaceae bacterium]